MLETHAYNTVIVSNPTTAMTYTQRFVLLLELLGSKDHPEVNCESHSVRC